MACASILLALCLHTGALGYSWDIEPDAALAMEGFQIPVYSGSMMKKVPALRILSIAQKQVGYRQKSGKPAKYAALFPGDEGGWCTEFVVWCAVQADSKWSTERVRTVYPFTDNASGAARFFALAGRYIGADGRDLDKHPQWLAGEDAFMKPHAYIPQPGDFVFINYYGAGTPADHSALVEGTSRDRQGKVWVHVIEGNMGGAVRRNAYRLGDDRLVGYGTPEKRAYTQMGSNSRYGGVSLLEDALRRLGYYSGKSKTVLNGPLLKALKAFKKDHGLRTDNRVSIPTQKLLDELLQEIDKP